jgi:hypothetical protein
MATRCLFALMLASTLTACGAHRLSSSEELLTPRTVETAFTAHGLAAGRDDTAAGVRRALRRSHVIASLLVTTKNGSSSVAEVKIYDSAARASRAVQRSRRAVSCIGPCSQLAAVRVRNVVVAPQPLYTQTSADTADLQRLLSAIHALRTG